MSARDMNREELERREFEEAFKEFDKVRKRRVVGVYRGNLTKLGVQKPGAGVICSCSRSCVANEHSKLALCREGWRRERFWSDEMCTMQKGTSVAGHSIVLSFEQNVELKSYE